MGTELQAYIRTAVNKDLKFNIRGTTANIELAGSAVNPQDLPEIFYKWPLVANLSFSRSYKSHPNGSLELTANQENIDAIRQTFINGNEVVFFGIGFRINGYNEVPIPKSNSPKLLYKISISLGGKWENYTDDPVFVTRNGNTILPNQKKKIENGAVNECNQHLKKEKRTKVDLSTLANRASACYSGVHIEMEYPTNTDSNQTVNWFGELQEGVRSKGYYLFLSDPNCIISKDIINSGTLYQLTDLDVISFSGNSISAMKSYDIKTISTNIQLNIEDILFNTIIPTEILNPPTVIIRDENTSIIPLGYEFKNFDLGGKFYDKELADLEEDSQNKARKSSRPRWKRIPNDKISVENGNIDANQAPYGVSSKAKQNYDLSLNFDMSGMTKTYEVRVTENGSPIYDETHIFGFEYTANQVSGIKEDIYKEYIQTLKSKDFDLAKEISQELFTVQNINDLSGYWREIKYEKTTYLYDEKTGYLLGSNTTGWRRTRYRQENSSRPETVYYPIEINKLLRERQLEEDEEIKKRIATEAEWKAKELEYFEFFTVPIVKKTRYKLEPFSKYYDDLSSYIPPAETYQYCTPSGKIAYGLLEDPNSVQPYFVIYETTENISFSSTANIENEIQITRREWEAQDAELEGETALALEIRREKDKLPKCPPLTTGEETYQYRRLQIIPAKKSFSSSKYGIRENVDKKDKYLEYSSSFNSLDANFSSSIMNETFNEVYGRPNIASRKEIKYERIQPDQGQDEENDKIPHKKPKYKYSVNTCGYSCSSISQGSISFAYAKTLSEALYAAQAELYSNNVTSTLRSQITVPFSPKILEWDKLIYIHSDGIRYKRRIISVNHNLTIQGNLNGTPFVKGQTSLDTGLDRPVSEMCFHHCKTKLPEENIEDTTKKDKGELHRFILFDNRPMGEIIPFTLQSRLNF